MAISTQDGIVAGLRQPVRFAKSVTATLVAGRPASLWSLAGTPGAGSFDTTLNGVTLSSSSTIPAGALRHYDPASGNAYLAFLEAIATQDGVLELRDRIWHNGGFTITSTSAQSITSPTWPSRCPTSGTDDTPSTNGLGVGLALEISAAAGAAAPTITVSYTNDQGTSGRTGTNILATANSPAIGALYDIGWQAGDTGVRSVQSLTLSASWVSGTMNLVAYRHLASLPTGPRGNALDFLTGGGARLYNGVVPWLVFIPNTTTATLVQGTLIETQG
jgi:hypothetical protein